MSIKNLILIVLAGFLFFTSCEDDSTAFKISKYSSMAVESRSYAVYTNTGLVAKISATDSSFLSDMLDSVPKYDSVKFTAEGEAVLYNRFFYTDPVDTLYNAYTFNYEYLDKKYLFSMARSESMLILDPQNAKGYSVLLSGSVDTTVMNVYNKRVLKITNDELFMDLYRVYFTNGNYKFITSQAYIDTTLLANFATDNSRLYIVKYRQYFKKTY